MNKQLPANWTLPTLKEVATLSGRIGWKGLTAKEYTESGPMFLSVHSLNYGDYVDFSNAYHISQHRYDESPEIMLQSDDVLICKDGAGIGKVGIIGELLGTATINSSLLLIRAGNFVKPKYLYYVLLSPYFQRIVQSRLEGATTPHLYQRDIKEFPVCLPPLPEQKRIVAILDEALAGISKAVAHAEKNLANARELFESYLNSIFTQKGEGWEEMRLEDLTDVQSGGTPLKSKPEYWGGNIAWFSSGELNDMETHTPKNTITMEGINKSNAKLFPKGSLLIGMYDTAALKMSILDRDAAFNQAISGLKPRNGVDLRFVFHAVNAIKPEVLNLRRGVRQKNLSLGKIKNIVISIPGISEQKSIVDSLSVLEREISLLESIYQQKLTALSELKQSILQKAFAGELTADAVQQQENG